LQARVPQKQEKQNQELATNESYTNEKWQEVENEVLERLRDSYRFHWNLPFTRETLASCSHLMLLSDRDIFPNFTLAPELAPSKMPSKVNQTVLRLAQQVFREYQRQLWDPKATELSDLEMRHVKWLREADDMKVLSETKERDLGLAKHMLENAQRSENEAAANRAKAIVEALQQEMTSARKRLEIAKNTPPPSEIGEQQFHLFGPVGILLLDLRSNRVLSGGQQAPNNDLLSKWQWDHISKSLESPGLQKLLIGCESPLILQAPKKTRDIANSSAVNESLRSSWEFNEEEQAKLLGILIEWSNVAPDRQVVVLTGGNGVDIAERFPDFVAPSSSKHLAEGTVQCGVRTIIKSRNSPCVITQLVTGPVTDTVFPVTFDLEGEFGKRTRVKYLHEPLPGCQRNFALVKITGHREGTNDFEMPSVSMVTVKECRLLGQYDGSVRVMLGPIVGLVTQHSAVILLEVAEDGPVSCVLTDSVSGEQTRSQQLMTGRHPHSFRFTTLRHECSYMVSFEGIQNASTFTGSFTTPHYNPTRFNVMVVSQDKSFASNSPAVAPVNHTNMKDDTAGTDTNVMNIISSLTQLPHNGVDVVLHIGGQVEVENMIEQTLTILQQKERAGMSLSDREEMENQALECIRNAYRSQWSLPQNRRMFAHGSHVLVWGEADMPTGFTSVGGVQRAGTPVTPTLARLMRLVYREYQRQLWDPDFDIDVHAAADGGRKDGGDVQNLPSEHFYQRWGRFGIFVLELQSNRVYEDGRSRPEASIVGDNQWEALEEALANSELEMLLLGSEWPFVDDSPSDAKIKGAHNSYKHILRRWPYNGKELQKLLRIMFDWQSHDKAREVQFVCGGICCGLDSVIQDMESRCIIRQFTVGPMTAAPIPFEGEMAGAIDERFSYSHFFSQCSSNFGIVECRINEEGKRVKCNIVCSPCHIVLRVLTSSPPLPFLFSPPASFIQPFLPKGAG
jgi:hypothetical protein